jgi:transposase
MTCMAVYTWLAQYRDGRLDALKVRRVPERLPKLSGAQLQRLYTLVVTKEKSGFWTRWRAFKQVRDGSNIQLLSFSSTFGKRRDEPA